jgi:hypothetical protein
MKQTVAAFHCRSSSFLAQALQGAFISITAAVVGVILNLTLVFGAAVIWPLGFVGGTNWFAAQPHRFRGALSIQNRRIMGSHRRRFDRFGTRVVGAVMGIVTRVKDLQWTKLLRVQIFSRVASG